MTPVFLDSDAWWAWADQHHPEPAPNPDPWRSPTVVDLTETS